MFWSPAHVDPRSSHLQKHLAPSHQHPVYCSLPWTVPDSRTLLTCVYLPSSSLSSLLYVYSVSPLEIPLAPDSSASAKPAKKDSATIQRSLKGRTGSVLSLTIHCSSRFTPTCYSINLLVCHLPVVSGPFGKTQAYLFFKLQEWISCTQCCVGCVASLFKCQTAQKRDNGCLDNNQSQKWVRGSKCDIKQQPKKPSIIYTEKRLTVISFTFSIQYT